MKKFVIGIIATMALLTVGCSDDSSEQLMDVASSTPMTFAVDEESLTRLYYIDNFSDLYSFAVVAQVDGEIYAQGSFYLGQMGTFEPVDPEIWVWPGDETKEVEFYASNESMWRELNGVETPIENNTHPFFGYNTYDDLLCAYTKTSCSKTKAGDGKVHLNFKHILAELGILVRGEFPEDVEFGGYIINSVDIEGVDSKNYHFDTNNWSVYDNSEPYTINYFDPQNYRFTLPEYSETYVEMLIGRQDPGDTFMFLLPGTYNIKINYSIDRFSWIETGKSKKAEVTLVQGQKNRIKLTLPYEPPA